MKERHHPRGQPRIIFHIGLEKTGTDSFQHFCSKNSRVLLQRGILYPVHGLAFAGQSHAPLVACYLPFHDHSLGPVRARADVVRSLRKEIEAVKPDIVLISAEHFSSRFRNAEIAQLARDFADYFCLVAVVCRDHATRVRSAYAQTIESGRTLSFEDYCNEVLHPDNRYVRYRNTIEPWEIVFGRENVRVLSLAPSVNSIELLCDALIPQAALLRTNMSYWDNKSPGASCIEALREINAGLRSDIPHGTKLKDRLKWLVLKTARGRIRDLLVAMAGDRPQGRFHMSEYNRARLEEIVDADRQWLATNYNVGIETSVVDNSAPLNEVLAKSIAEQVQTRLWVKLLMKMRRASRQAGFASIKR